jgi:hypothetical protein
VLEQLGKTLLEEAAVVVSARCHCSAHAMYLWSRKRTKAIEGATCSSRGRPPPRGTLSRSKACQSRGWRSGKRSSHAFCLPC